ncbi:acetyl-CoA synthetase-like protein [Ascobolus immersus RN42]|uniref:Acetyl-CoA synthetase-like protein n=1 Tax=Ascobolus immersus RN42 TaxID=1160509 RepID=A0A3N4IPK1_ASCIM|nr:acetyl-CoA synthetase-like protein [Ascobolus immersus RN42]
MDNPDLQRKLAELDTDLAEGDITQKGYTKKRAALLAEYGISETSSPAPSSASNTIHQKPSTQNLQQQQQVPQRLSSLIPSHTPQQSVDYGARTSSLLNTQGQGQFYGQQQDRRNSTLPMHIRNFSNASGGSGYSIPASLAAQDPNNQGNRHSRVPSGASYVGQALRQTGQAPVAQAPVAQQQGQELGFGQYAPQQPQQYGYEQQQGGYQEGYDQQQQQPQQQGYGYDQQLQVDQYGNYVGQQQQYGQAPPMELQQPQRGVSIDEGQPYGEPAGGYFSDFTAQNYPGQGSDPPGGPGQPPDMGFARYGTEPPPPQQQFSPSAMMAPPMLTTNDLPPPTMQHQLPLEPRDLPFAIYDPLNGNIPMSKFDNIATILRHRARESPKAAAYMVLDAKGKETATCTWEKLAARAEKVAQVIRDKSNLYRGDRVALIYREIEIIDFAVALLGCFIAGVVAVPINNLEDYDKLNFILTQTQAHLALTTDNNLKGFQRDLAQHKLNWPKHVEWWKTNEFGSYAPRRKDDAAPPLQVSDLAYIEFSRAPTGDLKGVVMSHRTIMHQMACLSALFHTADKKAAGTTDTMASIRDNAGKRLPTATSNQGEVLVTYLDPRQQIGLILGVLMGVYGGQTTVYCHPHVTQTPGLYAHIITRYRATLLLADYPGLKLVVYNYQQEPFSTRNFQRKSPPNFASVKLCLVDCLTVDPEFHEILSDRWLRPLGNNRAREVVSPCLCLAEHGGMVVSMRDWLGGEERLGAGVVAKEEEAVEEPEEKAEEEKDEKVVGYNSLIGSTTPLSVEEKQQGPLMDEILLDREALKTNEVVILATGDAARKRAGEPGTIRLGAFGYPIPDAWLAIVDPETSLLSPPNQIGEIWVDSPSLSGGFWACPRETEVIFHAKAYMFLPGEPNPVAVEPEFLRTGLLGCVVGGKVFVLGLYEDRIRQKVEWVDDGADGQLGVNGGALTGFGGGMGIGGLGASVVEYRYFFVQHLIITIMRNIAKIYDCSAFDVLVNDEHLPIIVLESHSASTAPTNPGGPPRQLNTALLESLAERCMEILLEEHNLRVYCVLITAPNALPRVTKNGRREIGNMMCRKDFEKGTLPCVHVKFGVERAVLNLPIGIDPNGGIFSPIATQARQELLMLEEKQYSGVDYREVVIDDRTSTALNQFKSIVDLLQWRVSRQAEELAYCTIDGRNKEGKGVTWKKLDQKIAAVASVMKNKWKLSAGDHVILIYTHSEDFIFATHACLTLGITALPLSPLDINRLNEDVPALLHMIRDFSVRAILVNPEVDHLIKGKVIAQHLKQSASVFNITVPPIHNTGKPPKQSSGCRDLGFTVHRDWIAPSWTALVWTYWTPDQRRISVALGHDTILGMCKVQKETCQMTSSKPILACVRSYFGLGFLHTVLMGAYVGAATYLISPVDYAGNPWSLWSALGRYKVKDAYATGQMLEFAMASMQIPRGGGGVGLGELRNLMVTTDGRPRVELYQKVRMHFAPAALDRTAISTVYSHVLNPMVASRSYMSIEPIELLLDTKELRRGLTIPVSPQSAPPEGSVLLLQDSGMVPISTQIAIVNPESRTLCHAGEYGEIWVESEACVKSFYGSKDTFDSARFNGRILDGNQSIRYVRTGDLGFLHTVQRPIGPNGSPVEMQVLFVLGSIGETFEVNGLNHFPMDIEASVERCHRNVCAGGCAVFQAGGLVVVLVEVHRKAYLASLVPVVVNCILEGHQLVVDIVAFVGEGDFPRSRLGEKQRGKVLAGWVTKKLYVAPLSFFFVDFRHDDDAWGLSG